MKKCKFIILILIVFTLTGCDATYNLTITEDKMMESVDFLVEDNKANRTKLNSYLESEYTAYYDMDSRNTHFYNKKEIKENKKVGMRLSYGYLSDELQNSSLLNRCYYQKSITKTDDYIVIHTDGKTTCFYKDQIKNLDTLTVNIKTALEVESHNADEVNGNVYTWKINDTNYQNKPIEMKVKLTKEDEKEFNWILWLTGLIISIFIVAAVIIIIVIMKGKNNNKL